MSVDERQRQAHELRRSGATYARIAEKLGYESEEDAWDAVQAEVAALVARPVTTCEDLRRICMEAMKTSLDVAAAQRERDVVNEARFDGLTQRIALLTHAVDGPKKRST